MVAIRPRPECRQSSSERREGKGTGSEHFFRNFLPYQRVIDGIVDITHMEEPAFLQEIATVESFSF